MDALAPQYVAFFSCFNEGQYFKAHEVLESIWLPMRQSPEGGFYKALIQLAGAFVHWEKGRANPCASLLKLARNNLQEYPPRHKRIDVARLRARVDHWLERVRSGEEFRPGQQLNLELSEPATQIQDDCQ